MNSAKVPLIYQDEKDLKRLEIELDKEDIDEEFDPDEDVDV